MLEQRDKSGPGEREQDVRERRRRPTNTGAAAGEPSGIEEPPAAGVTKAMSMPRQPLSAGQIRAIYGAMRTFRDDDLSRSGAVIEFCCDRCCRTRPAAGSLQYGSLHLCNGCATDYELVRTAGMESDLIALAQNSATQISCDRSDTAAGG